VFVRNQADASYLNIAHGLYPREPLAAGILDALAAFLSGSVTQGQGRVYAGGLVKFEPREMERLPVPGPALLAARAEQARAEEARAEEAITGQAITGQAITGQANTGQALTGQAG
jgi:hypothetical protein